MDERYLTFKLRLQTGLPRPIWEELGEFAAEYPKHAAEKVAADHGAGEYLVVVPYGGAERWTVTARTEFDVAKVEPEPTAPNAFVQAMEPPF